MRNVEELTPELIEALMANGYADIRRKVTGEVCAVHPQLMTWGLFVGLTEHTYRCRYCFHNMHDALVANLQWNGVGDPPGPWVKHKGRDERGEVVDRLNPMIGLI